MTPLEAITCATREGARALRLDGRVGQIAPGQAIMTCRRAAPPILRDNCVVPVNSSPIFSWLTPTRCRKPGLVPVFGP